MFNFTWYKWKRNQRSNRVKHPQRLWTPLWASSQQKLGELPGEGMCLFYYFSLLWILISSRTDLGPDDPLASLSTILMGGFCVCWGFGQVTLLSRSLSSCCPGCIYITAQHPPVTAGLPVPALPWLCDHSQTQMYVFLS